MSNRTLNEADHATASHNVSRRRFILSSTILAGAGLVSGLGLAHPSAYAASQTPHNLDDRLIHQMAEFVTAKKIDPALAIRAGKAITKTDPAFPDHITNLNRFIKDHNLADIEALQTAPDFDGALKKAAQKLISALYLGYAGEPVMLSSEDNVEFVTFREALAYRLTKDYTPVPSYSRWSTGYWAHLPAMARN